MDSLRSPLRKLRWKLTLSYTAITVGSLIVVGLIVGATLFSRILIPDLWITPEVWMEAANRSAVPMLRNLLSQETIDGRLISIWLDEIDMMLSSDELLRVGDAQFYISTAVRMEVLVIGADGTLLGIYNPEFLPEARVGAPFDVSIIPGLNQPYGAAMGGETDQQKLLSIIEPDEKYVIAIPIMSEAESGEVLGVIVADVQSMPTQRDTSMLTLQLVGRISLFFLLGAGIVGAIFGSITAKNMSNRFRRLADVADAWSEGNFSEFIDDPAEDEISQLSQRLNRMAEQLKDLLKRRQEMAVSEVRNRLARDLHDSAKQQALAASFQLGTAITLFDRNPETAKKHLIEADHLVNSVRVELTDLIHELRPPTMNGQDFDVTLNDYAIEWAHQSGIEVNVDVQGNNGLSLEAKQTLFRILQEALANVARHSAARSVDVSMNYDVDTVALTITDDGCGFDACAQHDGMGLNSMWERAESLNGEFAVESEPGEGTRISVTLPMS